MRHQYMGGFVSALRELGAFGLALLDTGDSRRTLATGVGHTQPLYVWREVDQEFRNGLSASVAFTRFFRRVCVAERPDTVLLHYLRPFQFAAAYLTKFSGAALAVALWGSDFYRATASRALINRLVLRICDRIICGEPKLPAALSTRGLASDRTRVCYFATGPGAFLVSSKLLPPRAPYLPPAKRIVQDANADRTRPRPLTVTIGNSANPSQQHLQVLDSLERRFATSERPRVRLLLPVSYGGPAAYISRLRERLKAGGWDFELVEHFLPDAAIAELRLGTDVYVNVQPTDSFSGSMRESMYLGTYVIYGAWLDYSFVTYPRDRWAAVESVDEVGDRIAAIVAGDVPLPPHRRMLSFEETLSWPAAITRWEAALSSM